MIVQFLSIFFAIVRISTSLDFVPLASIISPTESIDYLNNISYSIYEQNKGEVSRTFVCLNPNAKFYGGWGNVAYYAFTLMEIAVALRRVPIMNHALLTTMFDHPDERQNWSLISNQDLDHMKNSIEGIPRCNGINERTKDSFPSKFGLHGCPGNYNNNHEIVATMKDYLSKKFQDYPVETMGVWGLNVLLVNWIFSRPSKPWVEAVNNYKEKLFGSKDGVADLGIQIRSWRDLGVVPFENSNAPCIAKCAIATLDTLTQHIHTEIKIFVTSDNITSTDGVVSMVNLWASEKNKKVKFVLPSPELETWHTVDLTNSGRYNVEFSHIEHNVALLDWMVLSEAKHSVYTKDSGYSGWARMRRGIQSQSCDAMAARDSEDSTKCTCEEVMPNYCSAYLASQSDAHAHRQKKQRHRHRHR